MKKQVCIVLAASVATSAGAQVRPVLPFDMLGHRVVDSAPPDQSPAGEAGDLTMRGPGWEAIGPFGGDVQDVNVSPVDASIVLAGVAPGGSFGGTLYRSSNGGQTWNEVAALRDISVYDIEFDGSGVAYLGSIQGVWKSTDGGIVWTELELGSGINWQVFDVEIDPGNPNNLWACVAAAFGTQVNNLVRSVDGGATWSNATPPLASPESGRAVAVSPSDSNVVVASFGGGFSGQIWVTTNGGVSWTNRSAGLPSRTMIDVVHTGSRLLVTGGQNVSFLLGGVFESTNNGLTWTPLHDASWPVPVGTSIAVDPNNPDNLFVGTNSGVHRSIDGGETWQIAVGGTEGIALNSVRFAPGSSTHVVLGASSHAVLRSTNGSASFTRSSAGIGSLKCVSIEADPNDNDNLAVAFQGINDGGVFTSTDGGQTWVLEPVPPTRWNLVRFAPDGTLYGISGGPATIGAEGIYRREANGTWTYIGPDQGPGYETELFAMRFSEVDPNLILAGGNDDGSPDFDLTVWRTTDAGASWTKVAQRYPDDFRKVEDLRIVQDGTDQIMVACFTDFSTGPQEGGVLRSIDGGQTWAESSTGLPVEVQAFAMTASPSNPATLFVADDDFPTGGVHISTNAGQTWSNTGFTGRVLDLVADGADPQVFYILQATAPLVQRSQDGAATFSAFNENLGPTGALYDLTFAPGNPPRLFLASGRGAFRRNLAAPSCRADVNGDETVNVFDLLSFLTGWFEHSPAGDWNGDETVDVFDLLDYLDLWFVGC